MKLKKRRIKSKSKDGKERALLFEKYYFLMTAQRWPRDRVGQVLSYATLTRVKQKRGRNSYVPLGAGPRLRWGR